VSRHAAGPAGDVIPVTPSDTAFILPRGAGEGDCGVGLYIEEGGTLTFVTEADEVRGPMTVADFSHHPIAVKKILATGTTATGIWLLKDH
jgi:hypothetical protein